MEWLFKEDEYKPQKGNNIHIDKSVLSILGALSRIRQEDKSGRKGIYAVSSPVKFFFTIALVIFIALSRNFGYVILIDSYILLLTSLVMLKDIKRILIITAIVFSFSIILLFPSILMGNIANSVLIICKIIGCVTLLNILSHTTKLKNITRALKIFLFPDIFILIIDITLKYIVLLGDFSVNMLYAIKLRSVGRDRHRHTSLSNLLGVLFLKSKEMAEETFYAMECRCFTGNYRSKIPVKFHAGDILYGLVNLIMIALFFFLRKGL